MGRLGSRLENLECRERERAFGRVREFWRSLSVEEWALICVAAKAEYEGLELTTEERAVFDRGERVEIDEALRTATGWREGMGAEEEEARIHRLMEAEDPFCGRGRAVKRRHEELCGEVAREVT